MLFQSEQNILILLFHRVSPFRDRMWDPMDPVLFEKCISYVNRKYHVISLSELLLGNQAGSGKPIAVITFDDGYHDFLDYAVPVLDKFKTPASLFVVTDCIEKNRPTWTYLIDYYFEKTNKLKWNGFDISRLDSDFQSSSWINENERMAYGGKLKQYLKKVPATIREEVLEGIAESFSDVELPSGLMLSWKEVKELNTGLIEIGSHTISHPTLASIENDNKLREEIELSRNLLIEKLGTISPALSYPCGSYSDKVRQMAKEAGYLAGLAVNNKVYNPGIQDKYEIPRIELYNETWTKTKMRITGMVGLMNQLLRR